MQPGKATKTISLSKNTVIAIPIGVAMSLIAFGWYVRGLVADLQSANAALEAKVAVIESRRELDSESATAVVDQMAGLQKDLGDTRRDVAALSGRLDEFLRNRGSTTFSTTPARTSTASTPAVATKPDSGQDNQEETPPAERDKPIKALLTSTLENTNKIIAKPSKLGKNDG